MTKKKRKYIQNKCVECKRVFSARSDTHQRFCSNKCSTVFTGRNKSNVPLPKRKRTVVCICKQCGNQFMRRPSDKRAFCSSQCKSIHMRGLHLERTCKHCGKRFAVCKAAIEKTNTSGTYCSRDCYNAALCELVRGDNNPNWRGGTKSTRLAIKEWRELREITVKYNQFCFCCGDTNDLIVHHLLPWRLCNSNESMNLVVLCRKCHMKVESITRHAETDGLDMHVMAEIVKYNLYDSALSIYAMTEKYGN